MTRGIPAALLAAAALLWTAAPAGAHPGTGIVVDRAGRIYFTDLKQIWRIDPDGRLTVAVPNTHTHALALDEDGRLTGENDIAEAALVQTALVSIDSKGSRYFADVNQHRRETSRIFRKTKRGEISLFAGGAWGYADGKGAVARLGSIGGLTVGPDRFLYFTDGAAVRKASLDGAVTTLARGGRALEAAPAYQLYGSLANHLMGLAVDQYGNVYAANFGNRSVVQIGRDGKLRTVARSCVPWSPTGVAIAGADLYVLEYATLPPFGRVRVQKVLPDGRGVVLARVPR